ncbi:MAG: ComEC/Rec2 family competence protein [Flavobacteriales bacterium]|nr:ComEC/Rec2 family competence protein [Flavobacteriales bacterium]
MIPFIAGIMLTVNTEAHGRWMPAFFGISLLAYLALLRVSSINTSYSRRWIMGGLLYGCFLFAGASLSSIQYDSSRNSLNLFESSNEALLIGKVKGNPVVKERSVKLTVELLGFRQQNQWVATRETIIAYLEKDSLSATLIPGDVLSFEPDLKHVDAPKNPHEFDYRKYLSYHLIHQQTYLRSTNWKLIRHETNLNIFHVASALREHLIGILEDQGLNGNELAVASALILGYKDNLDAHLKQAYSSAGAMHVLAVSGLHVGIIFLIFSKILVFLDHWKQGRWIKGCILILILWFYALITGLSPSVMRAATMFSFVILAKALNRNSGFFNTLAASAFLLLIFNPFLVMDVGFQLSYLAVSGIVLIQPRINNLFQFRWMPLRKIWSLTAVTLAAQLATFPLGLYYFHQFPNYFIAANLIVVPLATVILCFGIATICLHAIPVLGPISGQGLQFLIKLLNETVQTIDRLPYAVSNQIRFTATDTWLIYLAIGSMLLLIAYRKFRYFFMGCTALLIFLASHFFYLIQRNQQKTIMVYHIPGYSALNFIDGTDNVLFSDLELTTNRSKLLFHTENNWIHQGVAQEKFLQLSHLTGKHRLSNLIRIDNPHLFLKRNYLQFYDYRVVIIDPAFQAREIRHKMVCDLIIITKNAPIDAEALMSMFTTPYVVIDASNSNYHRERWKKTMESQDAVLWDVAEKGAFQADL